MIKGRIIKGISGFYYIKPTDSPFLSSKILEAKARGKFRYNDRKPYVGDFVEVEKDEHETYQIVEILPRKNELIRPPVSNVDIALLCFSVFNPEIDLNLLDKLLINCLKNNILPIICFTKIDLNYNLALKLKEIYQKAGFEIFLISQIIEDEGLDLLYRISNATTFLAGPSGVGKSSLANRLSLKEMPTGSISEKLKRGKNTTRHIELLPTKENGFLLDTPGFSNLELEELDYFDLKNYYPEFQASNCRFDNCTHYKEPGCEVKRKVKEGKINRDRYIRYRKLLEELKNKKCY